MHFYTPYEVMCVCNVKETAPKRTDAQPTGERHNLAPNIIETRDECT